MQGKGTVNKMTFK